MHKPLEHTLVFSKMGLIIALVVALAANPIWVDSRRRPASARDGGKIIDSGIEPANVKVEGGGAAILLLHGFGAAIDWWDEVAPALAAYHRVIRLDLIGHGGTAAPTFGYSIPRQAQLAAAVLDKLDVGHGTVIGHSMGGEVAVALAEIQPERIERMILIDSPATAETTFTIMTKIYLTPIVGEVLCRFQSDQAIMRGLAQGFAPNFAIPQKFTALRLDPSEEVATQLHLTSEELRNLSAERVLIEAECRTTMACWEILLEHGLNSNDWTSGVHGLEQLAIVKAILKIMQTFTESPLLRRQLFYAILENETKQGEPLRSELPYTVSNIIESIRS